MLPTPNSPLARLAASREALVRQMLHDDGSAVNNELNEMGHSNQSQFDRQSENAASHSTGQVFMKAALAWWQHHPAQMILEGVKPALSNYAHNKPFQLIGIAMGVGAAAVLIKPWRLVSLTGLAVAALKSTKLSSSLLSTLPHFMAQRYVQQTKRHTKETL